MDIQLQITNEAINRLKEDMKLINDFEPIASIVWKDEGSSYRTIENGEWTERRPLPSGWGIGFYSTDNIENDEIQIIQGIKFYFGQDEVSEKLNGKILDLIEGKYEIIDK